MEKTMLFYAGLLLLGVFLSAISQVMQKKAALDLLDTYIANLPYLTKED